MVIVHVSQPRMNPRVQEASIVAHSMARRWRRFLCIFHTQIGMLLVWRGTRLPYFSLGVSQKHVCTYVSIYRYVFKGGHIVSS